MALLLPDALAAEGIKGTAEVERLAVGDVTWEVEGVRYFVERKAMTPESDDFSKSFYSGRLARQCRAMKQDGRGAVLVEGRWVVGPAGLMYDPESGLMLSAHAKAPLTARHLDAILLRLQFEGLVTWVTRDLNHTAWAVAKLLWMSLRRSRWL